MSFERRVLIWMCVLIAVNQLGFGGVVPALPLYVKSFGVSASAIGLAVAVYGLARFVVAMPSGQLCDRLGRRPTLAVGGVVSTLGNFWCAEAAGFPEFIVARFLAGAGAGLVLTAGQVVLADITKPDRRGRTMAIYHGVFIFAVGIGPFPGGLLADYLGLAAPFRAYAAVGFLVSLLAWFAVGEARGLSHPQGGSGWSRGPTLITQMRLLWAQIGFVLVCLVGLVNAVVRTGGLFNIIPVLGSVRLGLSVAEIGGGLALGSVKGLSVAYPARFTWTSARHLPAPCPHSPPSPHNLTASAAAIHGKGHFTRHPPVPGLLRPPRKSVYGIVRPIPVGIPREKARNNSGPDFPVGNAFVLRASSRPFPTVPRPGEVDPHRCRRPSVDRRRRGLQQSCSVCPVPCGAAPISRCHVGVQLVS